MSQTVGVAALVVAIIGAVVLVVRDVKRHKVARFALFKSVEGETVLLGISPVHSRIRFVTYLWAEIVDVPGDARSCRHVAIASRGYDDRANWRDDTLVTRWENDGVPIGDVVLVETPTGQVHRL